MGVMRQDGAGLNGMGRRQDRVGSIRDRDGDRGGIWARRYIVLQLIVTELIHDC